MDAWLFSETALVEKLQSGPLPVRAWALEQLMHRSEPDVWAVALTDASPALAAQVADGLAASGDARWAPVLRRAIEIGEGHLAANVRALGAVGQEADAAVVLGVLPGATDGQVVMACLDALAKLGGDPAVKTLRTLFERHTADDAMAANLARWLLMAGERSDIVDVLRTWRDRSTTGQDLLLAGLRDGSGVSPVVWSAASQVAAIGPEEAASLLEEATGLQAIDDDLVESLQETFEERPEDFAAAIYKAFVARVQSDELPLGVWMAERQAPAETSFRGQVVLADTVLGELARGGSPERYAAEWALGLALLLDLGLREDEANASAAVLWRLAAAPRRAVHPAIEQLAREVPAVGALRSMRGHEAAVVRARGVRWSAALGPEIAGELLSELEVERVPEVRQALVEVLRGFGLQASGAVTRWAERMAGLEPAPAFMSLWGTRKAAELLRAWTAEHPELAAYLAKTGSGLDVLEMLPDTPEVLAARLFVLAATNSNHPSAAMWVAALTDPGVA